MKGKDEICRYILFIGSTALVLILKILYYKDVMD